MQEIQTLIHEIRPVLMLYSEFLITLVAASIFSLLVGWMLQRSSARKRLQAANNYWEKRYSDLDETSRADTENLEEQLQSMGTEARTLQMTNKVLTDSLKKNDVNIQKARAEAIELNRQHTETQERLQRIIQQKDREILELGNRLQQNRKVPSAMASPFRTAAATRAGRDQLRHTEDVNLNDADTIAINDAELFDATVQMQNHESIFNEPGARSGRATAAARRENDDTLESTADLSDVEPVELVESTVVLDDEALAFARRSP